MHAKQSSADRATHGVGVRARQSSADRATHGVGVRARQSSADRATNINKYIKTMHMANLLAPNNTWQSSPLFVIHYSV